VEFRTRVKSRRFRFCPSGEKRVAPREVDVQVVAEQSSHVCGWVYVSIFLYMCICVCVHMCICVYVYMCICVCVFTMYMCVCSICVYVRVFYSYE
jgi:hypothetical protein